MTTIPRRTLTVNFQRSITAGTPNTMEVSVAPLAEPSSPGADVTLVGGTQTKVVLLANEVTPVQFDLVPSDWPGLSGRVLYRIAWRERYLGRQFSRDFVMPNSDVSFADLENLGQIIGGETYLQWTDRGTPGGVAALNTLGQVVDGDGMPIGDPDSNLLSALTAGEGVTITESPSEDGYTTYELAVDQDVVARRWSGPVVPASGNFGVVTHNLGTTDVVAQFRLVSTRASVVPVSWTPNLDGDTLGVQFAAPPQQGQYWAVVVG
jgi:hypothetical protein